MGKKPNLEQVITHVIEYVGKDACDQYFTGIVERKQQEKEALAEKELFDKRKKDLLEF